MGEVNGRGTPTWNTELNSGSEQKKTGRQKKGEPSGFAFFVRV
jgi:hypothetical protein